MATRIYFIAKVQLFSHISLILPCFFSVFFTFTLFVRAVKLHLTAECLVVASA